MADIKDKTNKATILAVDDTPANLNLLLQILGEEGYSVRPAQNGSIALDFVAHTVPDLVLLDIMMPEMDGFEVCKRLKAIPETQDVPVIFLSAVEDSFDKVVAFDVGGVDFLSKPFIREELLARIDTHLSLRRLQLNLEEQVRERTKELRESETRYADLYENAPDMYISVDAATAKIIRCNNTLASNLGYSKDEIIGKAIQDIYHPDLFNEVEATFIKFLETGSVVDRELILQRKDGSGIDVSLNISSVRDEDGNILFSRSTYRDISERKIAEQKLIDYAQQFEVFVEESPAEIFHYEIQPPMPLDLPREEQIDWIITKTVLVDANPAMARTMGFPLDEVLGSSLEYNWNENLEMGRKIIGDFIDQHYYFDQYESHEPLPNNNEVWFLHNVSSVIEDDRLMRIWGTSLNISDRKKTEEALRTSEAKYRNLIENLPIGIAITTPEGDILEANPAVVDMVGFDSKTELMATNAFDRYPDQSDRDEYFDITIQEGGALDHQVQMQKKDGTEIWVSMSSISESSAEGKIEVISALIDVTERKQAQEEIRRLSEIVEQVDSPFMLTDLDGVIEYVNPAFYRITGFSPDEVIGQKPNILKSGKMNDEYYEELWNTVLTGKIFSRVVPNKKKDGEIWFYDQTILPLRNEQGEMINFVSTGKDITLQIEAEQMLKDSQERLALATQAGEIGVWDWNLKTNQVIWDEIMWSLYGVKEPGDRDPNDAWQKAVHPDDRDQSNEMMQKAIEGGPDYDTEFRVVWPDDSIHYLRSFATVEHDEEGKAIRVVGVNWEITEEKLASIELQQHRDNLAQLVDERTNELQASERKYRAIVEDQTEFIIRYLPDTTITFVNQSYCEYSNQTAEKLIGKKLLDLLPESEVERINNKIISLSQQNPVAVDEYYNQMENGEKRWERWIDRAIFDDAGELIEYQAVGRDITERKLAEDELKERTRELEMFNTTMVDREIRIIEMKEEVNQLCLELGKDLLYPPVWQDMKP